MKPFKTIIAILSLSIGISCSGDDDNPSYQLEDPLEAYLANSGFSQKSEELKNWSFYEYGISFKPLVNGKITALVVKIPDVNTALKITVWDAATKEVIKTETVPIPAPYVTVEKAITAINLIKDKEYYFTINSNDWINRTKTDESAATYPIIAGNILVTGYAYIETTEGVPLFPTKIRSNYYAGDMSFKFQRTE